MKAAKQNILLVAIIVFLAVTATTADEAVLFKMAKLLAAVAIATISLFLIISLCRIDRRRMRIAKKAALKRQPVQ